MRSAHSFHLARSLGDAAGKTSQRVSAIEIRLRSFEGRAISPSDPPASAASCSRRVAAVSSPEPSAMTTSLSHRSAASIAQMRSRASEASIMSQRFRPIRGKEHASLSTLGQTRRPMQTTHASGNARSACKDR